MIIIKRNCQSTQPDNNIQFKRQNVDGNKTASKRPANAHNMLGREFGDYIVTKEVGTNKSGHILWECSCRTCGKTFVTTAYELTSGRKNTVCKHSSISLTPIKEPDKEEVKTNAEDKTDDILDEEYSSICNNVYYRVKKIDLLSVPVYYYIAHCIPADLSFYGETASRINKLYNMQERLINDYQDSATGVNQHDVVLIGNVFNMLPNAKKHVKPTLNDITEVVEELANYCYSLGVKYLAIPKIGCGNGLNWDDVWVIIKDVFFSTYWCKEEAAPIFITVCER